MREFRSHWWKVILVIVASIIMNIVMHGVFSPIESANTSLGEPSVFVKHGMLIPALLVWEVLTFSIFSLVFFLIRDKLPGKKATKGLLYGLSIGGLYFVGMFEAAVLFNSSVLTEFLMGLPDFISFLLSGALLGVVTRAGRTDQIREGKKSVLLPVFIIALFYFVGRYFAYTVLQISSSYSQNPAGTFFWTLGLGLWIGVIYVLMQSGSMVESTVSKALFFGTVVFGLNWLMNHVFLFTVMAFEFDLLVRVGIDILFTTIGVYAYSTLVSGTASGTT